MFNSMACFAPIPFLVAILLSGPVSAHAALPQSPMDCAGCHGMPPADAPVRDAGSGGFPGSHSTHNPVPALPASCEKCHPGSGSYTSGHRNGFINLSSNLNSSPHPSRGLYDKPLFFNQTTTPVMRNCSNVNCHFEAATPVWGGNRSSTTCSTCHGAPPADGSHGIHDGIYGPGTASCTKCHTDHATEAAPFAHATSVGKRGLMLRGLTYSKSDNITYPRYLPSQNPTRDGDCDNVYCHSDGNGGPPNTRPKWGGKLPTDCTGCHGGNASSGKPVATGSHRVHVNGRPCGACHSDTVSDDNDRRAVVKNHVDGVKAVRFGNGGSYTPGGKRCSNVQCHGPGEVEWGSTSCLGCHSVVQGKRAAVGAQFGAGSHHIQGTVTDDTCYQCHWEANSDGTINPLYHDGSTAPDSPVHLVVYGDKARPAAYAAAASSVVLSGSGGGVWTKSAPVTVNNSGNPSKLTDYQLRVTVPHASGMKSDYSDLRFTDGPTELSHWIESYTATSATAWIRVPSIPASSSRTLTMYYGNASATGSGNVATTMIPNVIAAFQGNCSTQATCGYMDTHAKANTIRGYPADIGTRNVSHIYWGSVMDGTAPGANADGTGRKKFFSRFRFLFVPDASGVWGFLPDSEEASELILNPADRTIPSGESVIASWYGGHYWSDTPSTYAYPRTFSAPGGINGAANNGYWLDYLQETWSGGGDAAVLWARRPGEVEWKNFSARNFPNMIYGRKYTSPEPTSAIGAANPVSVSSSGITAVEYTANGSRSEIAKLNDHCLGCHNDRNKTIQPFGDGKTPNQYAWDGTSVAARYGQTGTTPWSNYTEVGVSSKAVQTKAFSAHGKGALNQGGWDTKEHWADTRGVATVACYDCHNSHGSSVGGATTSYASATPSGGLLKDTTAGMGGYSQTYKPASGGSAATKNAYNAGAGLCFDCHLNETSGTKPWGYNDTYGASQKILGYWDTDYFGPGTSGYQQRYPYKGSRGHKGGHFGAYTTLSGAPSQRIGGLCTPCHDPHGVSPTLGANQKYAVPLLKGTWMTSPYREDVAPARNVAGLAIDYMPKMLRVINTVGIPYRIDENTFASGAVTETDDQFAGLCLNCHSKGSLTNGTNHAWKSKDRIHESVKGWKTANGTVKHNYTCSKCHAPHNSNLPRLMVTNCLDNDHKGQTGFNPSPVLSGSGAGDSFSCFSDAQYVCRNFNLKGGSSLNNRGSGRFPGYHGGPVVGGDLSACHENSSPDQSWNSVTPWIVHDPPTAIVATPGNMQATISWTGVPFSSGTHVRYGTTRGSYPTQLSSVSSPLTITGLANGQTIYFQVGATTGSTTGWSAEYSVTPTASAPAAATGITATPGNGQLSLSWTAGAGATSSNIRYGTATKKYTTQLNGVTSPRILTPLGSKTYYQIGATNGSGTTWSAEYSAMPLIPPPTVTATAGSGSVTIAWTLDPAATSSYILWGPGSLDYRTMVSPATSPHTIYGLSNGSTIYFKVYAVYGTGSAKSEEMSIRVGPPLAPTGISSTSGDGRATISWTAGVGATSSSIRYGTASGVYGATVAATSPHSLTGLTNGTTVYYQVSAINGAGTTWSTENSVRIGTIPQPTLIPQPTSYVDGSGATANIGFQWNGVSASNGNPVEYQVEVSSSSTFATIQYLSSWQAGTSWTQTLPVGTWYWRVQARDSINTANVSRSAVGSFSVTNRTPAVPTLIDETDVTADAGPLNVTLQWTGVAGPDGDAVEYKAEVSNSATFATISYSSGWISSTSWTQSLPLGTWYWRVAARDSVHTAAVSSASAADTFTLQQVAPPAPMIFPVSDYYYELDWGMPPLMLMEWTAVKAPSPYDNDQIEYNVEVNGVLQGWQLATDRFIEVAEYPASYTWRVQARNRLRPTMVSPWSAYDTFQALFW